MNSHRFIGDKIAPTPLTSVRRNRAMLGIGKLPQALQEMMKARFIYAETDGHEKPKIEVDSVKHAGRNLWKIGIPVGNELQGALPGQTAEQHPAKKFLEEIKENVS